MIVKKDKANIGKKNVDNIVGRLTDNSSKNKNDKVDTVCFYEKINNLALSAETYDLADKVLMENNESSLLVKEKIISVETDKDNMGKKNVDNIVDKLTDNSSKNNKDKVDEVFF